MKTIYVGYDGKKVVFEQPDIEIKIPILFRYYKTMDSFSLFINPDADIYRRMRKNTKKKDGNYEYAMAYLICPTKEFSNFDAWEVENMDNMSEEMRERLNHYWVGYTDHWFKNYCNENTNMWRGLEIDMSDKFYLNDAIISEAHDCQFFLSGNFNGIRFKRLSNVLIHIFGDFYEVE